MTGATSEQEPLPIPEILKFEAETGAGDQFEGTLLAGGRPSSGSGLPGARRVALRSLAWGDLVAKYGDRVNVVGVGSLDDHSAIEEFARPHRPHRPPR